MLISLESGVNDLHIVQLISLSSHHLLLIRFQVGSAFLVLAYPGCPGKKPLNGCSSSYH